MPLPLTAQTDRLLLRPFLPSDGGALFALLGDEETLTYEPFGVYTPERCQKEAARRALSSAYTAVCLRETDTLIGSLWLGYLGHATYELGFIFSRAHWGKSYAYEALDALIAHAFSSLGALSVQAVTACGNERSKRLLTRLCFTPSSETSSITFAKHPNRPLVTLETLTYTRFAE